MKYVMVMIACALPLAACNKSPEVHETNASVADVAKKMRQAGGNQSFVRPGLWESKVTIEEFEVPGMPPEMAQRMKTMMAENQEHDFQSCLTQDEVKAPKEDFFAGKNNECRYEHFTMSGGKIDAVMHCGGGDSRQTMEMKGNYSPENYQMRMSTKVEGGSEHAMSMRMRVDSHRVGECTGKDS